MAGAHRPGYGRLTVWLWRISNQGTLDGFGGLRAPGRWSLRGSPVVYCAPDPATALLETLVHLEGRHRGHPHVIPVAADFRSGRSRSGSGQSGRVAAGLGTGSGCNAKVGRKLAEGRRFCPVAAAQRIGAGDVEYAVESPSSRCRPMPDRVCASLFVGSPVSGSACRLRSPFPLATKRIPAPYPFAPGQRRTLSWRLPGRVLGGNPCWMRGIGSGRIGRDKGCRILPEAGSEPSAVLN